MWLVVVRDNQGKICAKMPLALTPVTIGRSKDRSILLDSRAISRFHGRIEIRDGKPWYVDEGSANGSTVDGKPVKDAVPVTELSQIELGREFRIGILQMRGGMTEKTAGGGSTAELPKSPVAAPVPPRPAPVAAPQDAQTTIARGPASPDFALRPMAPSAAPAPVSPPVPPVRPTGFQSPIAGMQFQLPEVAATPRDEASRLSDSMVNLLDQQIKGIQSQRSEFHSNVRSAKEQFELEWRNALTACRELHGRLQSNPRVQYFVVSRDEMEVSVKIADSSRRGHSNLVLSRRHPQKDSMIEGTVWFGEFGDEPKAYRNPKEALEDFVRRIAAKLA